MSDNIISKSIKVLSRLLMGISALFAILFYTGNLEVAPYITWAYFLFGLAILLSILFPLYFFITNPKNALKTLMGLAVMGVLFLIGYAMADATPIVGAVDNPNFSNKAVLLLSDTGLFATYILFGVAIVALLFTGVRGIFNR